MLRTLFMVHNETVSIWTHLIAAVALLALLGYAFVFINPTSGVDRARALNDTIDLHVDSLNNHSLIQEITDGAQQKIELLKNGFRDAYNEFVEAARDRLAITGSNLTELKSELKGRLHSTLISIANLKHQFEEQESSVVDSVRRLGDDSLVLSELKHSLSAATDSFMQFTNSHMMDFLDPMHSPNPRYVSRWPLFVFLLSATVCLLFSTIFHLFYPMSGSKMTC